VKVVELTLLLGLEKTKVCKVFYDLVSVQSRPETKLYTTLPVSSVSVNYSKTQKSRFKCEHKCDLKLDKI